MGWFKKTNKVSVSYRNDTEKRVCEALLRIPKSLWIYDQNNALGIETCRYYLTATTADNVVVKIRYRIEHRAEPGDSGYTYIEVLIDNEIVYDSCTDAIMMVYEIISTPLEAVYNNHKQEIEQKRKLEKKIN